jgi:hypothetical protein
LKQLDKNYINNRQLRSDRIIALTTLTTEGLLCHHFHHHYHHHHHDNTTNITVTTAILTASAMTPLVSYTDILFS